MESPPLPSPEELIERLYERLRASAPRREKGEGERIELGDDVLCDLVVTVNGNLMPGGIRAKTTLEMREYPLFPGLVEALVGKPTVSTQRVKLSLPDNYPAPAYAGREAELLLTIHQVFQVDQPEMDDPSALKAAGLGESVGQAMQILADEIDEEQGEELLLRATQEVLSEFGRRVKTKLSEELIDSELLRVWEENYEEVLLRTGFDDEDIDEAWHDYAEDPALREETQIRLKTEAGLRAVIEREQFAPDLQDAEHLLESAAQAIGLSREAAKEVIREQSELSRNLVESALRLRAVEYVMARAQTRVID